MKDKNKKVTVIIISILIIVVLALLISYSYFFTELSGTDQLVKVGELELVLNETSEGIGLNNAIGLSDNDGMKLTPSTFELKNNGSNAVDYTIYLDDNTIGDDDTRIDDKYLKYNLNKNGEDSGATLLTKIGANPNRILDFGTIEGGETNTYSLNLWITDEVDGNYSGQVFSGKLRVEVSQEKQTVSETLLASIPKDNLYNDGIDTFITGEDPDNYIWYSGKLWRAVSVNNEENTVKLVTEWNISNIPHGNIDFDTSHMNQWLNDTTVDGFLGNLREPDKFIVTDTTWDATLDDRDLGSITRPNGTTTVTTAVGLLNIYEYQSTSGKDASSYTNSYLNNGLRWWTLTPYSSSQAIYIFQGSKNTFTSDGSYGIRPSIVLRHSIKIASGNGTEENPYRLDGDYDTNLSGTKLNTRYSGEYIRFGTGENNLYRIVSHENGTGTKITSAEPLKSSGSYIKSSFGDSVNYSSTNTIGLFLNEDYIKSYVGEEYSNMIEENSTWYVGTVGSTNSYKLAKYTDELGTTTSITAKVGLLRLGELMASQFTEFDNNTNYWTITIRSPQSQQQMRAVTAHSEITFFGINDTLGIKPALNLKSNVIITSGDGTLQNPFQIELAS